MEREGREGEEEDGEVGVCGREQESDPVLCNREDARVGASPKNTAEKQIDVSAVPPPPHPAPPTSGTRRVEKEGPPPPE